MSNTLPVCMIPQYYCCSSHTDCRLYHVCSQFPKKPMLRNKFTRRYRFARLVPLSENEIRRHNRQYRFYNYLWGDLKRKQYDYRQNHREFLNECQRRNREKNNPKTEFSSVLFCGMCDKDCDNCKFDDCILPTWDDSHEYQALYREKKQDDLKEYFKGYYQENKQEKLDYAKKYYKENKQERLKYASDYRNKHKDKINAQNQYKAYKKKGYIMSECILKETTNPDYEKYEGTHGVLTIVKIPHNGKDHISFISLDKEFSFKAKIAKRLNDLTNPLCKEAYYTDFDGYEYTFKSTVNPGNPLWEMEHDDDFVRTEL